MTQDPKHSVGVAELVGVYGWGHLDALLLASLATELPLLLIGPHGTAKSLLVERIAKALGLSFRHYNASLINYDDLVGIPVPESGSSRLQFITTPGAIWDAEFVFFDEISRCRPDLQNKMFPIIHERRVAGIDLSRLRYRWAAMNPPAPEDPETLSGEFYLGSEALDAALTDRFAFIIPVPRWSQLRREDRRRLVVRPLASEGDTQHILLEQVEATIALIETLETDLERWLVDYVVSAIDLLEQSQLPQSPRRAYMLARAIIAVHAARLVLEGEDAELEVTAELALTYCLPQNATDVPPSRATVAAAHRQAWEISSLSEDDTWRQVLEETDMVRRVALADTLGLSDTHLSRLVTQALSSEPSQARRIGVATAMFLAFCDRRSLTAAAWEPLAQLAVKVLEPRSSSVTNRAGRTSDTWLEVQKWLPPANSERIVDRLARNYILNGFVELWQRENWQEALARFRADLDLFKIGEPQEPSTLTPEA